MDIHRYLKILYKLYKGIWRKNRTQIRFTAAEIRNLTKMIPFTLMLNNSVKKNHTTFNKKAN